mmetsp:Transcript_45445/g.119381  ORF Transcript_45445/g.119381 Transcript_45445/m.119381 type:complete len:205 (+) Transcript_45445:852-1466(+)
MVVVGDALLDHLLRRAEHLRREGLVALHVGERNHQLRARELRDPLEVLLLDAAHGERAGLDEVLDRHVVDALGREHHVGACIEQQLDAVARDVRLLLPNVLELLRVVDDDGDAHLHLALAEVDVEQRDLGVLDGARHALPRAAAVHDVPVDQLRVLERAAVLLDDADRLDGVDGLARGRGFLLDHVHGVDGQVGEELRLAAKDL